jgi:predicted nucleic acid-binding protein
MAHSSKSIFRKPAPRASSMHSTKIYLDNCCFNRPYDDQTQEKVHLESEAVLGIIKRFKQLDFEIIGSAALDLEISKISDSYKRAKVRFFYERTITKKAKYNQATLERVKELQELSAIRVLDRFHLAFAENYADMLLTTDLRFEKACSKLGLEIRVINPIVYFMEVMANDDSD